MDDQKQVEVMLQSGMTVKASEVMGTLIAEEVKNTIKANDGNFDLTTTEDIEEAGEAIAYYLEISTGEKVTPISIAHELHRQLNAV